MIRGMVVAIDFDGTIVDHEFPEIGKLKDDAKRVINKIAEYNTVCIWTCRSGAYEIAANNFLRYNDIHFSFFNSSPNDIISKSRKIIADIYIDDRNIFADKIDWLKIEKYFDENNL